VFRRAIDEDYYFEFIYDDIPLWGFIGDKSQELVGGENVTMCKPSPRFPLLLRYRPPWTHA
jgi:hypothetical protein